MRGDSSVVNQRGDNLSHPCGMNFVSTATGRYQWGRKCLKVDNMSVRCLVVAKVPLTYIKFCFVFVDVFKEFRRNCGEFCISA